MGVINRASSVPWFCSVLTALVTRLMLMDMKAVSAMPTVTYWMYVVGRPPYSGRRSVGMMRLRKKNTITWTSMLIQSEKKAVR